MTVVKINRPDAIDVRDGVHEAATLIDGMITCAEAMQDELWARVRAAGLSRSGEGFNEALTCALSTIRAQVSVLKALAD